MPKKIFSLALIILLLNLSSLRLVNAYSEEEARARHIEKVKAAIAKLGTGAQARIEVRLLDNSRVKGYISERGDDHFVVMDVGTGVASTVTYPQVKQVKGNNLSTGVRVAITVGLFVFLLVLLARNRT